jgi:hypothetical protein
MMIMKNDVTNSCGTKRGCSVTIILPHDSRLGSVLSGVHETKHGVQKVLSLVNIPLDKKLEKEGQMEKMAA